MPRLPASPKTPDQRIPSPSYPSQPSGHPIPLPDPPALPPPRASRRSLPRLLAPLRTSARLLRPAQHTHGIPLALPRDVTTESHISSFTRDASLVATSLTTTPSPSAHASSPDIRVVTPPLPSDFTHMSPPLTPHTISRRINRSRRRPVVLHHRNIPSSSTPGLVPSSLDVSGDVVMRPLAPSPSLVDLQPSDRVLAPRATTILDELESVRQSMATRVWQSTSVQTSTSRAPHYDIDVSAPRRLSSTNETSPILDMPPSLQRLGSLPYPFPSRPDGASESALNSAPGTRYMSLMSVGAFLGPNERASRGRPDVQPVRGAVQEERVSSLSRQGSGVVLGSWETPYRNGSSSDGGRRGTWASQQGSRRGSIRGRGRRFSSLRWRGAMQNQSAAAFAGRGTPVWYGEVCGDLDKVKLTRTCAAFKYSIRQKPALESLTTWPSSLQLKESTFERSASVLELMSEPGIEWFVRLSPVDAFGMESRDSNFINFVKALMRRKLAVVLPVSEGGGGTLYFWPLEFPPFEECLVGAFRASCNNIG